MREHKTKINYDYLFIKYQCYPNLDSLSVSTPPVTGVQRKKRRVHRMGLSGGLGLIDLLRQRDVAQTGFGQTERIGALRVS